MIHKQNIASWERQSGVIFAAVLAGCVVFYPDSRSAAQVPQQLLPTLNIVANVSEPIPNPSKVIFYFGLPASGGRIIDGAGAGSVIRGWNSRMGPTTLDAIPCIGQAGSEGRSA